MSPFLRANRRAIRRLSGAYDVRVDKGDGVEVAISAVYLNPSACSEIRRSGTSKGAMAFAQESRRLRCLTEDVDGLTDSWVFVVNGGRYYSPRPLEKDGEGSCIVYLAPEVVAEEGGSSGWQ